MDSLWAKNNNNFKLKVKAKPQRKDYITQQKATAMFTTKKTVILGCFVISSSLTPLQLQDTLVLFSKELLSVCELNFVNISVSALYKYVTGIITHTNGIKELTVWLVGV